MPGGYLKNKEWHSEQVSDQQYFDLLVPVKNVQNVVNVLVKNVQNVMNVLV